MTPIRVRYRFWDTNEFQTGTVAHIWRSRLGGMFVDIKRDGYRETAVLPIDKFADPALVELLEESEDKK